MNKINPPSPLRQSDYKAIEEALLDSARGRWFLSEYSRQNRTADTQMLLDAITKLEAVVMRPASGDDNQDRIRSGLIEMSESIAQTRQEISAMTSTNDDSRLVTATEELDAIVEATETATSSILEAAEDVQETAWVLREKGIEEETCDRLDQRATDIYTACSFQDITGQRTSKVVEILRYLESRVNSMIDIWGLEDVEIRRAPQQESRSDAHLLNGPQRAGQGLEQAAIDDMIAIDGEEIEPVEPAAAKTAADGAPATAEAPARAQEAPRLPVAHSPSGSVAASPPPADVSVSAAAPDAGLADISTEIDYPDAEPADPASPAPAETVELAPAEAATATTAHSDTVSVNDFASPRGLTLGDIDKTKTDALFS